MNYKYITIHFEIEIRLLFTDKSTVFFNKTSLSIVIKLKKKKIIIYVKW